MFSVDFLRRLDLETVFGANFYTARKMNIRTLRAHADCVLARALRLRLEMPEANRSTVLFFRSMSRDDYRAMSDMAVGSITSITRLEDYEQDGEVVRADNVAIADSYLDLIGDMPGSTEVERYFLYCCLVHYMIVIEKVFANEFDFLVVFADMQPVENLAVQIAKARGLRTITLQHGLYVDYAAYDNVNRINYENHVADTFLAWGEQTEQLIRKHHPAADVVRLGKPAYVDALRVRLPDQHAYVFVLMDQHIFDPENYAMLDAVTAYAEARGLDVHVRFHPSNDKDAYKARYPGLVEGRDILGADMIFGHSTTMIYEAMALGARVMQFRSDKPKIEIALEYTFQTAQDIEARIAEADPEQLDVSRRYFQAFGSESQKLYADYFKSLLDACGESSEGAVVAGPPENVCEAGHIVSAKA